VLKRVLAWNGYRVRHVMNITDVGHLTSDADTGEDKMEKGARRTGKTAWEIARLYTDAFLEDMKQLNIGDPTVLCRATDHIGEQIAFIADIEKNGFTYRTSDGVYFDTSKQPDYGHLARLDVHGQEAGRRVDIGEKKSPTDFALWKFSAPGEQRQMEWDSPWGRGFPGWHIECSAMAQKYLGDYFDIHCGGEDHIPVHHTNEIAQTEARVGTRLANFWLHGYFLLSNDAKMAKSAGEFLRVEALVLRGYDPLAFRYLCLTARYSRKLDYSDTSILAASTAFASLTARLRALGPAPADGPWAAPAVLRAGRTADRPAGTASGTRGLALDDEIPEPMLTDRAGAPTAPLSVAGHELHERFVAAIDDDLDLPTAVATIHATLRADLPADERRWLVLDADSVLGLDLDRAWEPQPPARAVAPRTQALLDARVRARAAHDWSEADRIRDELRDLGVEPVDRPDGTSILRPRNRA